MPKTPRNLTVQGMGAVRSSRRPGKLPAIDVIEAPASTRGVSCPEPTREGPADDPRPFVMRDTVPVRQATAAQIAGAKEAAGERRLTIDVILPRVTPAPPPPISGTPAPASGTTGRYTSESVEEDAPASGPPRTSSATGRYTSESVLEDAGPDRVSAPPASVPMRGRYASEPAEEKIASTPPSGSSGRETLRRTSRQPVRVDAVGSTMIVATHDRSRSVKPRLLDRKLAARTSMSAREVSILALVDGERTVQAVVDAAAMPEHDVLAIFARLVRLGIVSLSS